MSAPPGFEDFASLLTYEGDTRRLIAAIKFDGRRDVITIVGRILARLVDWDADVVTWAPTSTHRRRQRGFDQAELIAREVATELGLRCVPSLRRCGAPGHQTGRNRHDRLLGAEFIFAGDPGSAERLGSVMVIDDIRTTGATLCAAGDALLAAGVGTVSALTLAVTL